MPSTKRTMVRHELSSSLPHVLPLILQVLQQPSQGEMTVQAIKCLQAWVQFGIPMEETAPIVQRLLLAGKNVLLNLFILSRHLMPCPFTGPKMFCAGQKILSQPKSLTAFT